MHRIIPVVAASVVGFLAGEAALAQSAQQRPPAPVRQSPPAPAQPVRQSPPAPEAVALPEQPPQQDQAAMDEESQPDTGYYDEPPLDYYERQWRWYTRHTRPQRFAGRDLRRKYGYSPPFSRSVYPRGGFFGPMGATSYGFWGYDYVDPGSAYVQGRHDERRFSDWQERHDKGERSYTAAMDDGVRAFREADYSAAAMAFLRAAELNHGDPASRLHATYALVALGNYADASATLRKAMELQSRLYYLPLDIRSEYGPQIDFEAHYQRLREAAEASVDDPDLLALLAFYAYFSGDSALAQDALDDALDMNPDDRVLPEFRRVVRMTSPRRSPPPASSATR